MDEKYWLRLFLFTLGFQLTQVVNDVFNSCSTISTLTGDWSTVYILHLRETFGQPWGYPENSSTWSVWTGKSMLPGSSWAMTWNSQMYLRNHPISNCCSLWVGQSGFSFCRFPWCIHGRWFGGRNVVNIRRTTMAIAARVELQSLIAGQHRS